MGQEGPLVARVDYAAKVQDFDARAHEGQLLEQNAHTGGQELELTGPLHIALMIRGEHLDHQFGVVRRHRADASGPAGSVWCPSRRPNSERVPLSA